MTQAAPAIFKIPTKSPQATRGRGARRQVVGRVLASGTGRAAARSAGEVVELDYGIAVYPARVVGGRWRAVWYEDGQRRQCESVDEAKLAARLEKVTGRLAAGAPNMTRTGADLIACYLDPDRLPADRRWSRKHAHTLARLCQRFAAPVINTVTCQDITTGHTQQIVNAAPTPGEGKRTAGMISALVTAGIDGGYLTNPAWPKSTGRPGSVGLPRHG